VGDALRIVEIGSYEGKSTVTLGLGSRKGVFIESVDPHTGDISEVQKGLSIDTHDNFLRNIESAGVSRKIIVKRMTSIDAAKMYSGPQIGMLFIDG